MVDTTIGGTVEYEGRRLGWRRLASASVRLSSREEARPFGSDTELYSPRRHMVVLTSYPGCHLERRRKGGLQTGG